MDDPWQLRDSDAPSEWAIDTYVAGEASDTVRAQIEGYLAAHPEFEAVLAARRGGFDALPMANPQAMRARILQATEARPAVASPRPKRRWSVWLFGVGATAAAAAAIVLSVRPGDVDVPPTDRVIAKSSSVALSVFRARGEAVDDLISGDTVTAGDTLRFKPDLSKVDAERTGHVLVLGVPATGEAFGYAPAGATRSIPATQLDAEGLFPGAAQLDASTGVEWAHLVWCPQPFEATTIDASAPERVKVAETCRAAAFKLDKR